MSRQDLQHVMSWATAEGWNPVKYAALPFLCADPSGYHLLVINNKRVASISGVRYSVDFAFLGFYLVIPSERGNGYGKLLWDKTLASLADCSCIGLNAVMNQIGNYAKSGFQPVSLNTRWEGKVTIRRFTTNEPVKENGLVLTKNISLRYIIEYDQKIFPFPRSNFLIPWLKMPSSFFLVAVENGIVRGYGAISACEKGWKIAPLFADNLIIAEQLFQALCQHNNNDETILFDTNENNPAASLLARKFNLKKISESLRMYKGEKPNMGDEKTFGLTSLEIG